jgi:hypothetical protein
LYRSKHYCDVFQLWSFLCQENLYWYRSFSHLLHLHLIYVTAAAAVAISSNYQNCLQRLDNAIESLVRQKRLATRKESFILCVKQKWCRLYDYHCGLQFDSILCFCGDLVFGQGREPLRPK